MNWSFEIVQFRCWETTDLLFLPLRLFCGANWQFCDFDQAKNETIQGRDWQLRNSDQAKNETVQGPNWQFRSFDRPEKRPSADLVGNSAISIGQKSDRARTYLAIPQFRARQKRDR